MIILPLSFITKRKRRKEKFRDCDCSRISLSKCSAAKMTPSGLRRRPPTVALAKAGAYLWN